MFFGEKCQFFRKKTQSGINYILSRKKIDELFIDSRMNNSWLKKKHLTLLPHPRNIQRMNRPSHRHINQRQFPLVVFFLNGWVPLLIAMGQKRQRPLVDVHQENGFELQAFHVVEGGEADAILLIAGAGIGSDVVIGDLFLVEA